MENLAISAALTGNWKEAIRLNLQILKHEPKNVEALNRLARAYFQTGFKTKSTETYKKVLKIDKFNTIAQKNLQLVTNSKIERGVRQLPIVSAIPMFLEEPGVTRTLTLVRPSEPKVLARMHPGDQVKIAPRQHCVAVTTVSGHNLGRLSDDLAARLQQFIKAGSTFTAWVRSVEPANLKIFIRENTRASKFWNTPPFPLTEKLTYAAFTPPELVHSEKPDVSSTEDQDSTVMKSGEDIELEESSEQ